MRTISLCVLAGLSSIGLQAAELSPQDFAYGMTILTPTEAVAYRVMIPVQVYQQSARSDLGDLRIFNGRGELVPYAIEQIKSEPGTKAPGQALPLFPLHNETAAALNAMRLTIASQGSAISVQTHGPVAANARAASYVLDGQKLDSAVSAIQVRWPDGAADYAGQLRIEAGDTLGSWHTVASGASIANLHANGAQLIEDRVEFPATRAKFWHLSWVGNAPPFELVSAVAEPSAGDKSVERSELVVAGVPVKTQPGALQFDLGAPVPVDRVNLELPELNSIVEAELLARASPKEAWHHVAEGGFYRLKGAEGELHNAPIATGTTAERYWLVRLPQSGRSIGSGDLKLLVQWRAPEVVFLARGGGPYTLAYGSGTVDAAETPLAALPESISPVRAALDKPVLLGGVSRLQAPAAGFPWRKGVLWGALAIGVLLLALMAYRLSKEVGDSQRGS